MQPATQPSLASVAPPTARSSWWTRHGRSITAHAFLIPALLFIALTLVYPVFANLRMSLYDVNVMTFLRGGAPFVGLGNYATLLQDPAFQNAVVLSLIFTIGSLVFQFTIGFALALFFNRPFPGNNLFRALLLLAWLLPTVVSGSLFRWMLDGDSGIVNFALKQLGLLSQNRYWLIEPSTALAGVILANIWIGIPFNLSLLLAGLQNISPTLYEAASVDGANAWQRFRTLTLPLMRPVSLSVLLLGLIYTFKVFDLIYVMTGGGPVDATTVLPIYTYQLTFKFFKFGEGAAASTVLLLALLGVAVFYLRTTRQDDSQ